MRIEILMLYTHQILLGTLKYYVFYYDQCYLKKTHENYFSPFFNFSKHGHPILAHIINHRFMIRHL